jgi:hypothetical protein
LATVIDPEKWNAACLPDGFTAADGVAIMAIESGLALEPWQFDFLAGWFSDRPVI